MRWKTSLVLWCFPGVALAGTGSVQLVDGHGLTWFFNEDVSFQTTSSASGAASEASFSFAVAATTSAGGLTSSSLSDLFDGFNSVSVRVPGAEDVWYVGNGPATVEGDGDCAGRVLSYQPQVMEFATSTDTGAPASATVWRSIFVPADDDYARWVTFVRNDSAADLSIDLTQWNNLGSDANTDVFATSSGDDVATTDDAWVTSWQDRAPRSSDPRLGVLLRGPAAPPLTGLLFEDGNDNPRFTWTFTLAPGETGAIASFAIGEPTKGLAEARVEQLYGSQAEQTRCLSLEEQSYLRNFALCPAADACSAWSLAPITGACAQAPVNEGGTCDDGLSCTHDDVCGAGTCAGTPDAEVCNGVDDDCDGLIDDADADVQGQALWFVDSDGDSFGAAERSLLACGQPIGHVADALDCDDDDDLTFPGAAEVCGGGDEDCDGAADDADTSLDPATTTAWYVDGDADSWGAGPATWACASTGAPRSGDCDDLDAATHPEATEVCGGGDEDCSGAADDSDPGVDPSTLAVWYADRDHDGWGAGEPFSACASLDATRAGDCDDLDAATRPDAAEVCGGGDDDCDGLADLDDDSVDPATAIAWYADLDGDLQGTGDPTLSCTVLPQSARNGDDCDDTRADVLTGGVERCDADQVDEDCDRLADDADASAEGQSPFYVDRDGDGFGAGDGRLACHPATGERAEAGDCDDDETLSYPGRAEVCDGVDNDCDGLTDDADPDVNPAGYRTFYQDLDGDGFGDFGATAARCAAPTGFVTNFDDCDDAQATVAPNLPEVCGGGDEDCDGAVDDADSSLDRATTTVWYPDLDGDGAGQGAIRQACVVPDHYAAVAGDCDDLDPSASPLLTEVCGGVDEDCDGLADDLDAQGAEGGTPWWTDADSDGFGAGAATLRCAAEPNQVGQDGDCDDADAGVAPSSAERCDQRDEDCDGNIDDDPIDPTPFYADADQDGYGAGPATLACVAPVGSTSAEGDCADGDAAIRPNAQEVCNGVDDDCDGLLDSLPGATADGELCTPDDTDTVDTDAVDTVPAGDDTDDGRPIGGDDTDTTDKPADGGCSCAEAPRAPWGGALMLGLALLRRRRR